MKKTDLESQCTGNLVPFSADSKGPIWSEDTDCSQPPGIKESVLRRLVRRDGVEVIQTGSHHHSYNLEIRYKGVRLAGEWKYGKRPSEKKAPDRLTFSDRVNTELPMFPGVQQLDNGPMAVDALIDGITILANSEGSTVQKVPIPPEWGGGDDLYIHLKDQNSLGDFIQTSDTPQYSQVIVRTRDLQKNLQLALLQSLEPSSRLFQHIKEMIGRFGKTERLAICRMKNCSFTWFTLDGLSLTLNKDELQAVDLAIRKFLAQRGIDLDPKTIQALQHEMQYSVSSLVD